MKKREKQKHSDIFVGHSSEDCLSSCTKINKNIKKNTFSTVLLGIIFRSYLPTVTVIMREHQKMRHILM